MAVNFVHFLAVLCERTNHHILRISENRNPDRNFFMFLFEKYQHHLYMFIVTMKRDLMQLQT